MDIIFVIGRILFGGYFLMSGYNHFAKHKMMEGYAQSKGIPLPAISVLGSGLLIFLGGLGLVFGIYSYFALILILAFLVPVTFKMHAFWKEKDPMAKMADMQHFLKNIALIGASLMLLSIYSLGI